MTNENTGVRAAETDATRAREELGDLVSELGRRRHFSIDLKRRVRQHPAVLIGGAVLVCAVAAALIVGAVSRRRTRQTTGYKLRQLREAGRRIIAHPERVAADDPSGFRRIATSALTAAATGYARKLVAQRSATGRR